MKNKNIRYYLPLFIIVMLMGSFNAALAQKKGKAKTVRIEVESKVVTENGNPLSNAIVSSDEGTFVTRTNIDGEFTIKAKTNSALLIKAFGFENKVIQVFEGVPQEIVMEVVPLYTSSNDQLNLPLGLTTSKRDNVGAVSTVSGKDIVRSPELVFANSLQGMVAGLTVIQNAGGLADNSPTLQIRGMHRMSSNGIVTIVDGIERPINDLLAEEIEFIELLKDATSKILYGARAANGVLMVTTKRGKAYERVAKISVDYGMGMPERMPEYLNSYDYAKLYNEARQNDGLAPFYSEQDLAGYDASAGENDLRFPNVDYYNYFLNATTPQKKISAEFSGGNENTQYSFIAGYTGAKGLEKFGGNADEGVDYTQKFDRFNVRGNLDMRINNYITAFVDLAARMELRTMPRYGSGTVFSRMSSTRSNEFPLIINYPTLPADTIDDIVYPKLGGSMTNANNLYGELVYGGYRNTRYFNSQSNFGMNLDLDQWVSGLKARAYYTFDNYFYVSQGKDESAEVYAQEWVDGTQGDSAVFTRLNQRSVVASESKKGDDNQRNSGIVASVNYSNEFDDVHRVSADLSYMYYKKELKGSSQDIKNLNYTLKGVYAYDNKYIAELDLAYMGSSRFSEANRYRLFPAAGFAWVASEEDFLKDNANIDFLKVKASAGLLGYDNAIDYYLFEDRYRTNGSVAFNEQNKTWMTRYVIDNVGNPDLDWELSREINIGIEGLMFNKHLQYEFNYFNELRSNMVMKVGSQYSDLFGGLYPYTNYGKVANNGIEGEVRWTNDVSGDFNYSVGANFVYSKSNIIEANQIDFPDEYLNLEGKSVDNMFGYVDEGLFTTESMLASHTPQCLGAYGLGSIAYEDLNNDGVVDEFDVQNIGNSFPRTTLGIDLNIDYRGFGLYVLGTAQLGFNKFLNNNYYWMNGEDNYSVQAFDRWHATNNPNGIMPALTTMSASNNLRNSTFWMANANFFRIKTAELSYTFKNKADNPVPKNVKIYVRGSNLLLLSQVKELDIEAINGGVTNYPIMTTLMGGVSVTF